MKKAEAERCTLYSSVKGESEGERLLDNQKERAVRDY